VQSKARVSLKISQCGSSQGQALRSKAKSSSLKNWYYSSARQSTSQQIKAFFEKFRFSAIPRIALRITAIIFTAAGRQENFNNAPPLPALQSKERSLKN